MAEYVNGFPGDIGTLTNTGGTADIGSMIGDLANSDIASRFGILQNHIGPSYSSGRHLAVTADMTSATWNVTANSHEVFTVTGAVRLRMWIECTGTLTDAADLATIQFGYAGATNGFIAATDAAGKNGQTLTAGQMWWDTSPVGVPEAAGSVIMDYVVANGLDVGYELAGENLTGGSLVFHCVWEPLNATGAVVAGAGGAL